MIYSHYLQSDNQSTKWDRVRVNYTLVEEVIKCREAMGEDYYIKKHKPINTKNKNENFRQILVHFKLMCRNIRLYISNVYGNF